MLSSIFFYALVVCVMVVLVSAALAGFKAAPFVPTFQRDVLRMLELAGVNERDMVVDLGAGDGRFLITAARKFNAHAVGYEMSILMYLIAWIRILMTGTRKRVSLKCADFYHADLSRYSVICCFLTPMAMKKLEPKFMRECAPGTRIISYAFRLPTIEPSEYSKPTPTSSPVFLYRISAPPVSA